MEAFLLWVILVLLVAACLGLLLLWRRGARPTDGLSARMEALERQFGATAADIAGRLERVRGELQQGLADRLNSGLDGVKSGVEGQLRLGREEQSKRQGEVVLRLEQKFDALAERQARGLADSRQELAVTLQTATKALEEKFAALETRTNAGLDALRTKVDERLLAISDQVQKKLSENIKEGFTQFEKVQQHLKAAEEQLRNVGTLGASVQDLNALLKLPHLRGKFGEATLERLLADFLPPNLYELQAPAAPGVPGLADAVIKLPERRLPIDSKFPREQVLPLFESGDPQRLVEARKQLERVIKEQAKKIAEYIRPEAGTTNVALMFLPAETLWFEVVQNQPLWEHLARLGVFPVSPNTLLLALHSISLTHKWYQAAVGFERTARELSLAQKHFAHFRGKFQEVGTGLQGAQDAFQRADRHLSHYQSSITRLTGDSLPELDESTGPLTLESPEKPAS